MSYSLKEKYTALEQINKEIEELTAKLKFIDEVSGHIADMYIDHLMYGIYTKPEEVLNALYTIYPPAKDYSKEELLRVINEIFDEDCYV